jgi:hypothetical protein
MKQCGNGHAMRDADVFCGTCGERAVPLCPSGHPNRQGDTICGECGAPVSSAAAPPVGSTDPTIVQVAPLPPVADSTVKVPPPIPPTAPPPAPVSSLPTPVGESAPPFTPGWAREQSPTTQSQPWQSASAGSPTTSTPTDPALRGRRRWPLVTAIVVLLIVAGVAIAALVMQSGDNDTASTGDADPMASMTTTSTSTTASTTTTTPNPTRAGIAELDGILTRSAIGRASLSSILTAVQPPSCSVSPGAGYAQLQGVIDNRASTLAMVQGLSTTGSSDLATLKSTFIDALESSLASDRSYQRAVDSMAGCEPLAGSNVYMGAAAVTDVQATDAKRAFVEIYNPLAVQYGFPTRSADEL